MTPAHDPGSLGVARDVTAQGEEAEELRRERDLLSAALDTAGALVIVLDREGRIVRFNRACERATGYSFGEVRGLTLWDLFLDPEEIPSVRAVFDGLRAGHFPNQHENQWLTKDGARRLIAWTNTALLSTGGSVEYLVSTGIDITEQKRAEQTLQAIAQFEDAIARVSASFINLAPERVDEGIRSALGLIGTAYHVERAYVFQFSGDRSSLDCTHEWCAPEIEPQIDTLKDLPADHFAWTVGQITRSQVVQVRSDADLPPEATAERAEFESLGLQSRIVIPMVYQGAPVGFVGFDTTRSRLWTEQSLKLQVIGDILVNALEHKRAQAIQSGQRQFLELLAAGGDFAETLQTLVRLIEDQWPGMLGLILLLDEGGKHLHIGASVSLPADYVQSIEGLEIGPMVGSCGTACYRRERVIVEDTAVDPRWEGLRDLALRYGLRACWSEPVLSSDGRVVGTFAMYYRRPRAPTEAELVAIEMGAHLVGVAVEHRRAEQALRESEEKFRGIVELANVGIAIVQEARFRFVNRHWASMLGYTVEEMLGTDFMLYCAPEERDRILGYYTRRTRGERAPTRYETFLNHKDGTLVYAEVSVGMVPYEGRQATFVFLRDITGQKKAGQALVEAYRTLEQRVEERTRELSTLLEVSQKLASTLELGPLLGSILDELRGVVPYEGCAVYSLEGDELVTRAHRGRTLQSTAMSWRWPTRDPLDRLVLTGREPILVADTRGDSPEAHAYRESVGKRQETQYPHIRSWLGVPLIAKGKVIGELALDHSRPGFFAPAHAGFAMAFANQAAAAIENARLYQAAQNRRAEAERRRQVADGLRDILAILNSNRPLAEILDYIVTQASRILGSDATVLCRLDRQTQWLAIQAAHGLSPEFVEHMAFQVGRVSIIGEAVLTQRPTTTSDLAERLAHPDVPAEAREMAARFAAIYRTILAVPLLQKEEVYGALALYLKAARRFTEEEVNLAVTFADQAALAIENARLREQAEEAAAMQERGRLARELHDSVTQSLYSVTMYTEAAARMLPPGLEAAAGHLRDARDTAQEALREMRLMIYQLRPPVLERGGLAVALQVRLDAVERRGGMRADLIVEGEDRLPPAVQAELHQIAQEALNNALKHAHARQVRVRLEFGEAVTRLAIQDDGLGFDPADAQAGGGLGLPGMRERAEKVGGQLEIESALGRGTRIQVEVPVGGQE